MFDKLCREATNQLYDIHMVSYIAHDLKLLKQVVYVRRIHFLIYIFLLKKNKHKLKIISFTLSLISMIYSKSNGYHVI